MKNIISNMSCLYEHMKITENRSEKKCECEYSFRCVVKVFLKLLLQS